MLILLSFLDSTHDGRLTVICAFNNTGENPADSSVFWLLQAPHHSLLHHADKLLIAQFSVSIVVEESENLGVEIIISLLKYLGRKLPHQRDDPTVQHEPQF